MSDRILIADRYDHNHDPVEVAEFLDGCGDRAQMDTGEALHDAADVMRGLLTQLIDERKALRELADFWCEQPGEDPKRCARDLRYMLERFITSGAADQAEEAGHG